MSPVLESEISAASSMAEILRRYPGAQRALFRKYHIGGCSSCGFRPEETLREVCARNGNLAIPEVLAEIERSHLADLQILLEPKELAEWRAAGHPFRLLDIRTREEFEAVRIEGATLFTQNILAEMLARWPRTDVLVIYDHAGKKSMDAAAYFLGHGFTNVRALRGGIDAWAAEVESGMRRYRME